MISLQNIDMIFGEETADRNHVLKNINLTIKPGDFITVVGSNGAGKSTLYNVIAGTLKPTKGEIFLTRDNGVPKNITKDKEYKRAYYIGRIFQDPLLGTAGKMSIADNMLICSKKGWKGLKISLNKKLREEFKERLKILGMGLENRINENVEKLSGGQRQALTLLMAVMSKPSLLLLDEHTAALDPGNAEAVMKLTKQFAKDYNLTVMMITHNMNHALEYGNRLLMMDSGEIIMDISGKEKENLTMDDLIKRFKEIKKQELNSDAMLLG